ncbi:MAG: hypothetical protein GY940_25840 [bacterium]|nr:hypothetical protein [bacterium]
MNEAMIPHLLGVNHRTLAALQAGQLPGMLGQAANGEKSQFAARLAELLAGNVGQNETNGTGEPGPLDRASGLNRPQYGSIADLFRDSVLTGLKTDTSLVDESGETLTTEEKFLRTLENGTTNETETVDVLDGLAISSAKDIVFRTGNENSGLIEKINNSATVEERLGFSRQLRDKIIDALKADGHTAYDIGKPDKISIDGTLYDVIKASRGVGLDSRVQFMEVPPATPGDTVKEAIYTAGENSMDLISQISGAKDSPGRRVLATQFRDQLVANLNTNGYTASAGASPDKIEVNGVTYDIIRSLNDMGANTRFHVMQVG